MKSRGLRKLVVTVVGLGVALAIVQVVFFPAAADYRHLITGADRVEISFFIIDGHGREVSMAVLRDRRDREKLAASITYRGVWVPWDVLVGNTYRLRVVRGGEQRDIIVRGGNRIREGRWTVPVSPELVETIHGLVDTAGGVRPDVRTLVSGSNRP